jgi:hypothetical protein
MGRWGGPGRFKKGGPVSACGIRARGSPGIAAVSVGAREGDGEDRADEGGPGVSGVRRGRGDALAASGCGAGLLSARGGWAERERTGGKKGDGPRAWAAARRQAVGAGRAGESGPKWPAGREREDGLELVGFWAGLEWGLGLVEGFVFYFYFYFSSISNSNKV